MNHDTKTMVDGAAVVVGLGGFLGVVTPVVALVGGVLENSVLMELRKQPARKWDQGMNFRP